jgi:hypothetical protein
MSAHFRLVVARRVQWGSTGCSYISEHLRSPWFLVRFVLPNLQFSLLYFVRHRLGFHHLFFVIALLFFFDLRLLDITFSVQSWTLNLKWQILSTMFNYLKLLTQLYILGIKWDKLNMFPSFVLHTSISLENFYLLIRQNFPCIFPSH